MRIQHNRELEGLPWQSSSKHSKLEIHMPYKQKTALHVLVCVYTHIYDSTTYICFCHTAMVCGILVSQLGIEAMHSAMVPQSLDHWAAREVPR